MATFGSVSRGRRARKPVPFPLSGARWSAAKSDWDGETVTVDVRPLTVAESMEAVSAAAARARSQGVHDPGPGDEIYDVALEVETLLRGVVDHEAAEDARDPARFFESYEQVAEDDGIQREHIAYLYEQQQIWQQECSPRELSMPVEQMEAAIVRAAAGDARDFLGWSPAMRWSFTRFTAALALTSLTGRSRSGSPSAPTSPPAPAEPPPPRPPEPSAP